MEVTEDSMITVLIIEDRRELHDLYKEFLKQDREHRYRFLHAYSAKEGLDKFRDNEIDCLLLDYKLPDMNGVEVIEALAKENVAVPAVMLTGHGNEQVAVVSMKVGAQDYLSKSNVSAKSLCRTVLHATERARMLNQVERYRKDLERSNQDLERFANILSHDLKSPLRAITQHIQLLEKDNAEILSEESLASMYFVQNGAERMRNLIDALFEFSRLGFEKEKFEVVQCDALMTEVQESLAVVVEENNAKIRYDSLPTVLASKMQLLQLLQNLIANAIKFCERAPEISVTAEKTEDHWLFAIQDNGIGIPQRRQNKIFTIFKRLHTQEEYPGTGVGLAICKRVIENHHGKIWLESQPEVGTTFYFTLPVWEDLEVA